MRYMPAYRHAARTQPHTAAVAEKLKIREKKMEITWAQVKWEQVMYEFINI